MGSRNFQKGRKMNRPEPNQIFRHFKGNLYKIITVATHTETEEKMVVYQALYGDYQAYVRPLAMFMEEVDRKKYPKAEQKYRFQLLEEIINYEEHGSEPGAFKVYKDTAAKEEKQEENILDPMVEAYLDAKDCKERLEILELLSHRITDEMITTMAIVTDFEIPEGTIEERLASLKNCLRTREKFESTRLR